MTTPNIIATPTHIPDDFGVAGSKIPPRGGGGTPTLRDMLRELQTATLALDAALGAVDTANLASTAHNEGASLIGIEDAASLYTATTVEAALAEVRVLANAAIALDKRTVTITEATLTDAVNGEAQAINIGAVLPANANVLAHEVNVATLFSGGGASAVKLDIGGTSTTALVSQMDVFTGAATGALSPRTGAHAQGKFSAQQLVATFTPDVGHTLAGLTAGSLTITVWFSVLP